MPVTDELGRKLQEVLASEVNIDLREGQSFEDWLTVQITPLPFLQGYDNARRAATASHVIAEIADILDQAENVATLSSPPLWLRQLVAIWDAEGAKVLTFNYDTLLERAINVSRQAFDLEGGTPTRLRGDLVVYPAPPAGQQVTYEDMESSTARSLQILKLHGSLSWYWASGDSSGSTLVRVREKRGWDVPRSDAAEVDFSGVTSLDRYLIPPVTRKDGYYGSYLANSLWRSARKYIQHAPTLTLIGYSLPPADRVASLLMQEAANVTRLEVVNSDSHGVANNLSALDLQPGNAIVQFSSLDLYTQKRMEQAIDAFPKSKAFNEYKNPNADVVLAIAPPWSSWDQLDLFLPVWDENEHLFEAMSVPNEAQQGQSMPWREYLLNRLPPGHRQLSDFVTVARLLELVRDGRPFVVSFPNDPRTTLVAIGAEWIKIGQWDLLHVKWAPYQDDPES